MTSRPASEIKLRLILGFGSIILILVVVLVVAYTALSEAQVSQRAMLEENFANLYDLPALRANINAERLAVAMLIESTPEERDHWLAEISDRRRNADSLINKLILQFRNSPEESDKIGLVSAARDAYQSVLDTQIVLMLDRGRENEARALFTGVQTENHMRMRVLLGELERMELEQANYIVRESEQNASERSGAYFVLGALGVLLATGLSIYTNRTVSGYLAELRTRDAALSSANRALNMLNDCNSIVMKETTESRLLERICRSVVDIGGYMMAWVGYAINDEKKSVKPMAVAGADGEYVDHADVTWSDSERGRGPTGRCIRTGEVTFARDISTQPGFEPWRFHAREKGYKSSVALPLKYGNEIYGALMVYSSNPDAFSEEETRLLLELAEDMAYATYAIRGQAGRISAEKKVRESASFVRSLLEASSEPMMVVNYNGIVSDLNVAAEDSIGKGRTAVVGSDFWNYFTNSEEARAVLASAISKGIVKGRQLGLRHVSGRARSLICNVSAYQNEDGETQVIIAGARVDAGD